MQKLKSYYLTIDDNTFNLTFDSLFLFDCSENRITDIHVHVDYEIFININGILNINTKNESYIFDSNKLIIISPLTYHYTFHNKNSYNQCYHFLINFNSKKNHSNILFNALNDVFTNDVIKSYNIDGDSFDIYCKDLNGAIYDNYLSSSNRINALLTLLVLKISDLALKNVYLKNDNKHKTNYSDEIYRIISKSYMENLKISDIAEKINLCERQTSRIIKKHYGKSFSHLLTEKRLFTAALLLVKTDYPIKQIIEKVNFETESYFYILFKKYYNISPLQYRKQYLKDNIIK